MLYITWSQDVLNSLEKRKKARPAHLERGQQLIEEGRFVSCGSLPAGVYESVMVKPFLQVLP